MKASPTRRLPCPMECRPAVPDYYLGPRKARRPALINGCDYYFQQIQYDDRPSGFIPTSDPFNYLSTFLRTSSC